MLRCQCLRRKFFMKSRAVFIVISTFVIFQAMEQKVDQPINWRFRWIALPFEYRNVVLSCQSEGVLKWQYSYWRTHWATELSLALRFSMLICDGDNTLAYYEDIVDLLPIKCRMLKQLFYKPCIDKYKVVRYLLSSAFSQTWMNVNITHNDDRYSHRQASKRLSM